MPGRGAETRAGHLTQLGFDSLAAGSESDSGAGAVEKLHGIATAGIREVRRSAPPRRYKAKKHALIDGITQATFDGLFDRIPGEEQEQAIQSEETREDNEQNGRIKSINFEPLVSVSPDDGSRVSEGEPAGRRVGEDSAAGWHIVTEVNPHGQDGLPGSNGDSQGTILPARGRRVILDEPEPGRQPSRDFRITEAHRVGTGGLHEKATANIDAIRLLKTLEADSRDATDEEKAVLVKYAGWGALPQVFEPSYLIRQEWRAAATELQSLLTDEEYEKARATTPNAHFTSPVVVSTIWQGLQKLGIRGNIEVLEPACGAGHFLGLMPEELQGGHRTGVELDSITARIAKKLYPDSTIFEKGFEETPLPNDYFDAVVGNVPFGDYGVHDPSMKKSLTRAIHDYFFAKSAEKVRPGGILALITSRYTMDKQDETIRRYLAEKADLVAAVRLPNTAFKGNAGTEVVTDILFLQKRIDGKEPAGERWTQAQIVEVEGHPIALNEYYVNHPDMMLGKLELAGTMYRGHEPTVTGDLTLDHLQRAILALPEDVYIPRGLHQETSQVAHLTEPESLRGMKDGGYGEVQGELVKRCGDRVEPAQLTSIEGLRVRGLLRIRDAVREVFRTQLDDAPEPEITAARQHLNQVYDQFVSRFGSISAVENIRGFYEDPDHPLLLSLETYDQQTKTAAKTTVFKQRTLERYKPVEHVENASEALAVSLNETGGINWERMASLTGLSIKELRAELAGQVFQNVDGAWETADEYLSGDVRAKLRTAEAAAAINPVHQQNVEALKAVQPEDILPGDINARLASSWIPKEDVRDFIAELLQVNPYDVHVGHAGEIATWTVKLDYFAFRQVSNTTTHGTGRGTASDLIEDALNMRVPTIYDTLADDTRVINQTETIAAREAQQKLKDRFAQWIWEDPTRTERLARLYNDRFNTIRLRTYDGSHLTFPAMNKTNLRQGDLDQHQKSAVWRVLQNKNTLLGHAVGAGKTWEITAACMELKRVGLAKKPMVIVPNHLVDQWGASFLQLYPQANIFVAGKEFFTAGNRERAMARIATGNYDAVIISHKSFESLPVSNETFNRFLHMQIASLEEAIREANAEKGDNRSIVKQLEKAKKRLEAKIKDRAGREKKDDGVTFEQLGIDRIFVDEADLYKNLGFTTKMQRIAGLPNTESNRALDMYMKTRYVSERGGGIIFATGTPISNTMAEMYTLMRYLSPEVLEAAGVSHFDAWAANFGEAVTALELSPDGSGYRMHTRFAKFVNLPELLSMFHTFADIQTAEMLKLPRPQLINGKPFVARSPASAQLKAFVEGLVERARRIKSGGVDPSVDNMLTITTDGRKAALDMRLVDTTVVPDETTKIRKAVERVSKIWQATQKQRLTQLVFCDISTPHPGRFNAYDEIRDRLIALGIPASEIRYIHQADTDAKKKALFDAVNAGQVRILLGSTEKMGAGTNVQERLIALHHLDAPWRPRDIEQREGRILRQGNSNPRVYVFRYVTEGSFDAYMWQTLETKARFIQQVMSGRVTVREAEDLEGGASLSFAEIKAIASGNPEVMEKIRIDTEVRRLDTLRAAHFNQQFEIARAVRELPERIAHASEHLAGLLADINRRDANQTEAFTITINNQVFSGKDAREKAGEALQKCITSSLWGVVASELQHVGTYKGFEIAVAPNRLGRDFIPELYLRGRHTYQVNLNPQNPLGTIYSIEAMLRSLEKDAEGVKATIEHREKELEDYNGQLNRPFEQEEKLRELVSKQQEMNSRLDLDKSETQVVEEREEETITGREHLNGRRRARREAQLTGSAVI